MKEATIKFSDFNEDLVFERAIHVDDFGGTWTAIDCIQTNQCSKFDLMFDDFDTICSKIDDFSSQELSNFIDTFTTIDDIADDVLLNTGTRADVRKKAAQLHQKYLLLSKAN